MSSELGVRSNKLETSKLNTLKILSELRTHRSELFLFKFDPLDINFDKGQEKRSHQRSGDETDQSESLDPSQHSEEEEQRMDIRSGADKKWSEEIVYHTNHKYSHTEQEESLQNSPFDQ